jgi:uncharacterized protein (TIGR00255 family)
MTGFGRGEAAGKGIMVTTELRSVNSRYLDISFYIPRKMQQDELTFKRQIQKKISRGNIEVTIRVDMADTGRPEISINPQLAEGYKRLLDELRRTTHITEPVKVENLLQFEEIFVPRVQDEEVINTIGKLGSQSLDEALEQLSEMRLQEGQQLEEDLHNRANDIDGRINKIQQITEGRAAKIRDKLKKRIQKLVENTTLDDERLEMEVAVLVDKQDITEELVRMHSHIKFFKEALENKENTGRRLKFLAQEMNREINTIGAKADNTEISQQIVGAKESLEQIREQVINVE